MELMRVLPGAVLLSDAQRRIVDGSDELKALIGYPDGFPPGTLITDLLSPGSRILFDTHVMPLLLAQGELREFAATLAPRNGERVPVLVNAKRILWQGVPHALWLFFVATQRTAFERELLLAKDNAARLASQLARTVEELHAAQQSLRLAADVEARRASRFRRLSLMDALTGLGNRRAMKRAWVGLKRSGTVRAALAVVDLDYFKQFNDRFGHAAGDAVLRSIAEHLRAPLAGAAMAFRLGGEEFALVLPGADIATAKAQVAQLQAALAGTPGPAPVTLSAGIAALQAGDTLASWLERADRQLYAAKAAGRACVRAEGTP